jgi:hypothetical protein
MSDTANEAMPCAGRDYLSCNSEVHGEAGTDATDAGAMVDLAPLAVALSNGGIAFSLRKSGLPKFIGLRPQTPFRDKKQVAHASPDETRHMHKTVTIGVEVSDEDHADVQVSEEVCVGNTETSTAECSIRLALDAKFGLSACGAEV